MAAIQEEIDRAATAVRGRPPVILCAPQIRAWMRKMIEVRIPSVAVLSYNEIVRGFEVESHGIVVITDED